MRRIRIAVCLLFVISCAMFGIYMVKVKMVEDNTPPKLTCEKDSISVSVKAETKELLEGITAKDNRDGDITDSVRVSSMSHFIQKGKRTVTYVVFDEANLPATVQRTLVYTDYVSPKIYLKKPLRYAASEVRNANFAENMTAEDCLDGDLTNQIRTIWDESFYMIQPGTYSLTLQVNNSAGDVCMIPVEVQIVDSTDRGESGKSYPVLSDYIAYTKVGKEINPGSYLIGIKSGNDEHLFGDPSSNLGVTAQNVLIKSNVNYSEPGVYTVEYTYTNKAGITAVTKLYVVVEE